MSPLLYSTRRHFFQRCGIGVGGMALSSLLAAAEPVFQLYGQPHRLRSHINLDPGTHNFERDNRQAFYRVVGDTFFPGDPRYRAEETDSTADLKTAAELAVPLPADNLDFHQLAVAASASLPRPGPATRETLAAVVHYQAHAVTAPPPATETRGGTTAACGHSRIACAIGIALRQPNRRAS